MYKRQELPFGIEELKVVKEDTEGLTKIYEELEFKSWLQEEPKQQTPKPKQLNSNYELINSEGALDKIIKAASKSKVIAIDTETTGLDYMDADLVGVSMAYEAGKAFYIPFGHEKQEVSQLKEKIVLEKLKPFLEKAQNKIIGQNIKFDRNILARYGIKINSIKNDTMMMSYVLDASATRHNLDALSSYYLNHKTSTLSLIHI